MTWSMRRFQTLAILPGPKIGERTASEVVSAHTDRVNGNVACWIVSFQQCCVIEKSVLFILGRGRKDAAHRRATDVEAAGDLGFAKARAA